MTFQLKSYSDTKLLQVVENNLSYLQTILEFNIQHQMLFFRISSDLVPFASHSINQVPWLQHFRSDFENIGSYIREHDIRISMHPSQFVVINAVNPAIVASSVRELEWHVAMLDAMQLSSQAKVQIHVGGAYGDKVLAIARFIEQYHELSPEIQSRLVIENDDKIFNVDDCLKIHEATGVPIIFDNLHHDCLPNGDSMVVAMKKAHATWASKDGCPMMDYSSQEPDALRGKHATTLNSKHFANYIQQLPTQNVDIMFEIKDKENSVLKALKVYGKRK